MTTLSRRLQQASRSGDRVLSRTDTEQSAPDTCDHTLEARLRDLEGRMEGARVLEDMRRELRAYQEGCWQFGYAMCALERR